MMVHFCTSLRVVGSAIGISRSMVYRLVDCGELETVKIGRRRLVKREAIATLTERGSISTTAKQ